MPTLPSLTVALPATGVLRRAETITVIAQPVDTEVKAGGGATLSGGAIAGIVIGSILGFILICWLIYSLTRPKRAPPPAERHYYTEETSRSRPRHHHHHRRGRSHSTTVRVRSPSQVYMSEARYPSRGSRHHSRSRSRQRY
ncbi:unnamed protein product [Parascedosporium putredinis]|uniref:Uncharacterized protein n=1 Tax=Parascedosporium putredinis TaxID=1442378 RepID=A0A9P1HDJ2_9PEZI|nr:unnamed protein product [Parascedosporium putredinis]CAI8004882.1 unnamed protein product [Parascedosporium putredinis]